MQPAKENPMKELVVGLDGSADSRRALRWAAAVADRAAVPLRAVEAWSYPPLTAERGWSDVITPSHMDGRTVDDIRAVVSDVLGEVPDFVTAEALRGPAAGAILRVVGPDSVLVLGSRGRGGFAGLLLGSVSRECIEHAPCPVVIPRDDEPPTAGDSVILVGKDGSENSVRALDWAGSIGELTGAAVVAVYVWQTTSSEVKPQLHRRLRAEARGTVEAWIAEGSHRAESVEAEGEPRTKLVELCERMDAKLIVVGRRGTSRLRGLRTGGVSSYLVSNSPTTVAVIPPRRRAAGAGS
jgi:nucleotide-binding universal stress UspA family protein